MDLGSISFQLKEFAMNSYRVFMIVLLLLLGFCTLQDSFFPAQSATPVYLASLDMNYYKTFGYYAGAVQGAARHANTSAALVLLLGALIFVFQSSFPAYARLRRVMDIAISLAALTLAAPLMLLIAVIIKLDSRGPVFYDQIRVGLNRRRLQGTPVAQFNRRDDNKLGSLFRMYKFRTMRADAETASGAVWAAQGDNRVTRAGKFLRKFRLDELPQFYNVLKGDMSFIGPRPERPEFVKGLNQDLVSYNKRLNIKPGITGLAQVRFSYAASLEDTKKKLRYDLIYLKKDCLLLDLQIFFRTFSTVLFAKGAR
jgi:lipopolysaccharide/colanic/teichoic acid biosynthesis glycosyltransferase